MRQIISLQVGQSGNQLATSFWQTISQQHLIFPSGQYHGDSDQQLDMISTYFNQSPQGNYVPRAVLIDMDSNWLNALSKGSMGNFFRPDNYLFAQYGYGAGNNWAKGHYTDGAETIDQAMDIVRKEAEGCDCLQGFQVTHGLGGGTGSGLGTLLIQRLKQEYPSQIIQTFSIFPSSKTDGCVVEPYNCTLSLSYLMESVDDCIVFDNEALFDICSRNSNRIKFPTHQELNKIITPTMSTITNRLRFPNPLRSGLGEVAYNLVPFPRLNFLMVGSTPLISRTSARKRQLTVAELTQQIFQARNTLCDASPSHGRYFAASAMYRGKISTSEASAAIISKQIRQPLSFVQTLPKNINFSICDTINSINGFKTAAVSISNSTAVQHMFRRFSDQFTKMFRRKAFTKMYMGEGMDEMEFYEAQTNIRGLISEYQDYNSDKQIQKQ